MGSSGRLLDDSFFARAEGISPSLQRTCPFPGALGQATCDVNKQALWAVGGRVANDPRLNTGSWARSLEVTSLPEIMRFYRIAVAFAAMDYVQANVSTALYGIDSLLPGFVVPTTAEEAMSQHLGICGNQVAVYEAILKNLGIPVRHVQLWYTNAKGQRASHILAEVEWDARWHLFDVTFGAHYPSPTSTILEPDPLSAEEVLTDRRQPIYNPNNPDIRAVLASGADPFDYLHGTDAGITTDDVGEVVARPAEHQGNSLVEEFHDIPNFVGNARADITGGTTFVFPGLKGRFDVTIHVTAHGGCSEDILVLDSVSQAPRDGTIQFKSAVDPQRLSVVGPDDVCYLVMRSIEFTPTPG
jgi:hypothetical protein